MGDSGAQHSPEVLEYLRSNHVPTLLDSAVAAVLRDRPANVKQYLVNHLVGKGGNPPTVGGKCSADPRLDPRQLQMFGQGIDAPDLDINTEGDAEALHALVRELETPQQTMRDMAIAMMGPEPKLQTPEAPWSTTQTIKGSDGNDVTLYVTRPTGSEKLPCLVHLHGGGGTGCGLSAKGFAAYRRAVALEGLVVVGVEFRNPSGALGNHPFPAGLNDCSSAVQWVHDHKAELNASKIIVSGESGGGTLALATALRAKKEGWVSKIDGVYAMCSFLSGTYMKPPPELGSLTECCDYFLPHKILGTFARLYDPNGTNARNPLCWPLHAAPSDLDGLPPHAVSVNELDPVRDENLSYYRKLFHANVPCYCRTVTGTVHTGDLVGRDPNMPVFHATLRDVASFARSL